LYKYMNGLFTKPDRSIEKIGKPIIARLKEELSLGSAILKKLYGNLINLLILIFCFELKVKYALVESQMSKSAIKQSTSQARRKLPS
jgi:hypothetical protein